MVVEGGELGCDFCRREEELEGFAGELDAGGEGVVGELLEERERGAGLAVVEGDAAAWRLPGDESYGCAEGREGEVRDDSEPGEVSWLGGVEAGLLELLGERFAFEVYGRVGEVLRNGIALVWRSSRFHCWVAGWSTSKTWSSGQGLR